MYAITLYSIHLNLLFNFTASTGVLYNTFNGWRKMVVGAAIGGGLR